MKQYAQLYLDARRDLMQREPEQLASMLARHLVCFVSGKTHEQFLTDRNCYASEEVCAAMESAVQRILADEPLAYVLGEWSFYGLNLYVNEHVLIPRDDTCALAELAIKQLKYLDRNPRVLDLCTGSGCIGLAIASHVRSAHVTLGDLSNEALTVAKKNVARLNLGGRALCLRLDAMQSPPEYLGKFHMIVSNPPYITTEEMKTLEPSVRNYEPHLALHGGADGLAFYRAIVKNYTPALRPGGFMAFEFGEGQGDAVCAILEQAGYTVLQRAHDFNHTERAVLARYDRKEE